MNRINEFVETLSSRRLAKSKLREERDFFRSELIVFSLITLIIAAVCVGIMVLRFKVFGSF